MKTQCLRSSGRFRLSSFFTVTLLFIGSSQQASAQHVDPAPNAGLRALTFARHADTTFAGPTGMGRASDTLQRCDRISAPDQDVACDITFQQTGGIGTFGTTGDSLDIITTQAELTAVLNDNTAWVKVVTMIGFCGGAPGTNIIGCAPTGTTMVIDNGLSVNTTGEVTAHEFGHNQGLGHRSAPGTQNLMRPSIGGDEVNQAECTAFHAGLANNGPIAPTDFPPNITCPFFTTAQCSAFGGTPRGDPQLAAFFAGVSAEDGCEAAPTITDDSPSLFPVGVQTPVTFTATDGGGNTDSCIASVNVVDTANPVISAVSASPNVLWSSNHKMTRVTVAASVSDVCDAAATCQIASVSSNEPVNGLGDGDTAPDWVITGALTVNLRAERSGTGSGRVYTITVQCTDASGNSSPKDVGVTVPHNL